MPSATIRCTEKLGRELGVKLQPSGAQSAFDWHANLVWLNRRKHVLFCSDGTRLSCLTAAVTRAEMRDLGSLLRSALRRVMEQEGFSEAQIQRVMELHGELSYARTRDRSVLGTINDNTLHLRSWASDSGRLDASGLAARLQHLNHMPMKPLNWTYAIEAFRAQVSAKPWDRPAPPVGQPG